MSANAHPFNARLVVGLIAAGLAAFAILLFLIAFGGSVGPRPDGRGPTQSVAATGFRALVTLVTRFRSVDSADESGDLLTEDLLIVALDRGTQAGDIARLREMRGGRATLLILPKWVTQRDPSHRGWVRAIGPGEGQDVANRVGRLDVRLASNRAGPAFASGADFLEGLSVPIPNSAQVISGESLTPLLVTPGGDALIVRLGDEPHYVAADPDLFNNHGLREPARARAALALIDMLNSNNGGGVSFAFDLRGVGGGPSGRSLLRTALEPPFLAMTLALIAAALLAGLHGAFRFGQARREARAIALGKAALVENSAGLIRLAGREARLGGTYADVLRTEAARLAGAPPALQGEQLDAYLDRLSKGDRPPFSALAARLAAATDRHELVAAARALFSWKKDIIR